LLFSLIALAPAAHMLVRSVYADGSLSLAHYISVFGDPRQTGLLGRSLGIALAASLFATLLGVIQAFLILRSNLSVRRFWRRIYLLPLCIPPHVHAIAWIYLCGETGLLNRLLSALLKSANPLLDIYSPLWAAAILALALHPLVTLMTYSGLLSMDQRLEEAARQYHPVSKVLRKVTLPLLLPHILSGGTFVFIFAFFNYGVPSLLRVHTYPVEIFAQFSAFYNEAAATALAVPVIMVALVILTVQRFWMKERSYVVIDGGRTRIKALDLGWLKHPANSFMFGLSATAIFLPLLVLILQTRAVATFAAVWRSTGNEIVITTVLSLTAASVMLALAYLLGAMHPAGNRRVGIWRDVLFFAPLAFPATVLGIGMIYLWNRPYTQFIYTSAVILIIAYAARFIPFVQQAVIAGMRQVGPGLREAALLYQRSWWKRTLKIEAPLCLPGLVAGWTIAFILCMGELGVTLLVIPPGLGTISLKIYNLMHYGANQMVAALSLVLIAVNLAVAAFAVLFIVRIGRKGFAVN